MCGLSAIIFANAATPPSDVPGQLEASLKNINHRGPDSQGVYVSPDSRVGLGHVRLSIIDLSHGQQPLSDEDDKIFCVVTGELYDYARIRADLEAKGAVFKTHSDSELVVQLYKHDGFNLLPSLRGEFAFVLYDSARSLVFAARDRFGIKPLYYTINDNRLMIASEMKAFLPFGWKAEWDIDSIMHAGDLSDDRTVFKGARKLVAGNYLIYRPTGYLKVQQYWDLDYTPTKVPQTVEEMIEGVRQRLFDAIRLRLRSDVPIGMYLSGGIDSAAIAGMATHLLRKENPNARLVSFTLAFPDAKGNDEGPIAGRTAEHIGAETHMVNVTEAALVAALEPTIWHTEQPNWTFHGPGKFLLSEFVNKQGYKVVLSGEGADEFFGGYAWLPVDYLRQADEAGQKLGLELPSDTERVAILDRIQGMSVPVLSLSENSYTDATLARQMLGGVSCHRAYAAAGTAGPHVYNQTAISFAGEPYPTRAMAENIDPRVREKAVSGEWHKLHIASYVTAKTIMQQSILNQMGERSEMAHSVEGRPPFLDHHLVNYINGLPASLKVRPIKGAGPGAWSFTDKWLLREAVKPYVTEEMYARRKLSYNAPAANREASGQLLPLQAHLKARITRESVERLGFFDWGFIETSLAGYLSNAVFPADGALDTRAQLLMYVLSFIVLQERFSVPSWSV